MQRNSPLYLHQGTPFGCVQRSKKAQKLHRMQKSLLLQVSQGGGECKEEEKSGTLDVFISLPTLLQ